MYVWSQLSLTQLGCTSEGWKTAGWAAAIPLHQALEAKGGCNFGKRAPHEYFTAGSRSLQLLYFDNNSHDLWNASTLRVLGRSWHKCEESSLLFFLSRISMTHRNVCWTGASTTSGKHFRRHFYCVKSAITCSLPAAEHFLQLTRFPLSCTSVSNELWE